MPHNPEQYGLAERMIWTIQERARSLMFDGKLDKRYRAAATSTAVPRRTLNQPVTDERHLRNRFREVYGTETGSVQSMSLRVKSDDSRADGGACEVASQVRVVYPDRPIECSTQRTG